MRSEFEEVSLVSNDEGLAVLFEGLLVVLVALGGLSQHFLAGGEPAPLPAATTNVRGVFDGPHQAGGLSHGATPAREGVLDPESKRFPESHRDRS